MSDEQTNDRLAADLDALLGFSIETSNQAVAEIERLRAVLESIVDGYGVNHTSRWARDTARKALADV